jgi:hypothetical protein
MSFEQILEKIKEQSAVLKTEILPGDPTSRVKAGMISQARTQIASLRQDFRDEALRRSVFIVVFGKRSKETSKLLQEEFAVKVGSPRLLAEKIVNKIHPSLYMNKPLHPSVIDTASSIMDELARDLGIEHYPMFYYDGVKHAVQINGRKDLEILIENTLLEKVGGEIFAVNAVMDSLDGLIEEEYTSDVLPIVMETDEESVEKLSSDLRRITKNVFTMSVSGGKTKADLKLSSKQKLDRETLEKALIEIKKNLKQ